MGRRARTQERQRFPIIHRENSAGFWRVEAGSTEPVGKRKLSYREQKEWGSIEQDIIRAEAKVAACRTAVEDPTVVSDAAALEERLGTLETARAEVERLYARWAELEEMRLQATRVQELSS